MKYIKTCKAIRIETSTMKKLQDVNSILQAITHELKSIAQEDDNYKSLADDAWHASASLDDFLDSYREEISPLD